MATTISGASGLVPGTTEPHYEPTVITFGAASQLELLNEHKELPLWFAVDPAGNDFVANTPGSQFVRPGEWLEIAVTGTPVLVVKSSQPVRYLIRKTA